MSHVLEDNGFESARLNMISSSCQPSFSDFADGGDAVPPLRRHRQGPGSVQPQSGRARPASGELPRVGLASLSQSSLSVGCLEKFDGVSEEKEGRSKGVATVEGCRANRFAASTSAIETLCHLGVCKRTRRLQSSFLSDLSTPPRPPARSTRSVSQGQEQEKRRLSTTVTESGVARRRDRASSQSAELQRSYSSTDISSAAAKHKARHWCVVQFGNNSKLIRSLFQGRPIALWPDPPEINLLWSHYANYRFLDMMADGCAGVGVISNEPNRIKLMRRRPFQGYCGDSDPVAIPAEKPVRAHNHFEGYAALCTKAGLCESLSSFFIRRGVDPFGAIPLTYLIDDGPDEAQYDRWRCAYESLEANSGQRMWLVKPGGWTNRGCGIGIYDNPAAVLEHLRRETPAKINGRLGADRVWVVQKYLETPLLIHGRKFDIRAYCLVTQDAGDMCIRGFFYHDFYLRTASTQYTTTSFDPMVHLNNDAVQSKGKDYGKYETANKLTKEELQKYLDAHHAKDGVNVRERIVPQLMSLAADAVHAVADQLNPRNIEGCFEIYGLDFMIDDSYRAWLIEVNANSCMDLCTAHLAQLIPSMLDDALKLTVDRIFSRTPIKQGTDGTGWIQVFCSTDGDAEAHSCVWLDKIVSRKNKDVVALGSPCLKA